MFFFPFSSRLPIFERPYQPPPHLFFFFSTVCFAIHDLPCPFLFLSSLSKLILTSHFDFYFKLLFKSRGAITVFTIMKEASIFRFIIFFSHGYRVFSIFRQFELLFAALISRRRNAHPSHRFLFSLFYLRSPSIHPLATVLSLLRHFTLRLVITRYTCVLT